MISSMKEVNMVLWQRITEKELRWGSGREKREDLSKEVTSD